MTQHRKSENTNLLQRPASSFLGRRKHILPFLVSFSFLSSSFLRNHSPNRLSITFAYIQLLEASGKLKLHTHHIFI